MNQGLRLRTRRAIVTAVVAAATVAAQAVFLAFPAAAAVAANSVTLTSATAATTSSETLSGTVVTTLSDTVYLTVCWTTTSFSGNCPVSGASTAAAGSVTTAATTTITATVTGLSPGTLYYWTIEATDTTTPGNTASATPGTFTTAAVPNVSTQSPGLPALSSSLIPAASGSASATLRASVNVNGDTNTVVRFCLSPDSFTTGNCAQAPLYYVVNAVSVGGTYEPEANQTISPTGSGPALATNSSNELVDLDPGTTYYYEAYAINGAGTTYDGGVTSFTTRNNPGVTTSAVSTPTYDAASKTAGFTMNGTVITYNDPQTAVYFCYSTVSFSPGGCTGSTNQTYDPSRYWDYLASGLGSVPQGQHFPVTGLYPGTSYWVQLVAQTYNGNRFYDNTVAQFTTANAPTLSVSPATVNSTTSATLSGTLNPNGDPNVTSIAFCYGPASSGLTTATSCSASTAPATPSSFSNGTGGTVNATLTGLTPGITYDYYLLATNSAGQVYASSSNSFISAAVPTIGLSSPNGFTINAAGTQTGVALHGAVNANGDPNVHNIEFCWKTTSVATSCSGAATVNGSASSASGTSPTTEDAVVAPSTSLAPGTTYYVNLEATNSLGTVYSGPGTSFTTPAAPTVVTASALTPSYASATLRGTIDTNGDPATTFWFCYSRIAFASGNCASTSGATVTASQPVSGSASVSSVLTNLVAPSNYYVELMATNEAGQTYDGGVTMFTTTYVPIGVAPPNGSTTATPSALTGVATGVGTTTATLNAVLNANGDTNTHAIVFCVATAPFASGHCGAPVVAATPANVSGTSAISVSAALSGLVASTTYYVEAEATTSTGTEIYGGVQSFTTAPALSQAALSLASGSATIGSSITLSPSGGSGSGALSFTVTGGTASGCALNGSTLTATGPGTCLVSVVKAADATYQAASAPVATFTFSAPPTPLVPGVVVVHFAAGSWALGAGARASLVALGHALVRGALIRIAVFGFHSSPLAHRRVAVIERSILAIVAVRVRAVFVTGSDVSIGNVVTLSQ